MQKWTPHLVLLFFYVHCERLKTPIYDVANRFNDQLATSLRRVLLLELRIFATI